MCSWILIIARSVSSSGLFPFLECFSVLSNLFLNIFSPQKSSSFLLLCFFKQTFWQWNISAVRFFECLFAFFSHFPIVIFVEFLVYHFLLPQPLKVKEELKIKTTFRSCPYAKKRNIAGIVVFFFENISATGRLHYS